MHLFEEIFWIVLTFRYSQVIMEIIVGCNEAQSFSYNSEVCHSQILKFKYLVKYYDIKLS